MMSEEYSANYMRGFFPYAAAAFLIGIVGGFSTVLGPAFVRELGIAYNNTTWTALAQAMSTAACAPILGKLGDALGRRKTLLMGIAVFTAGNILTATASSLMAMLLARFIVGVGTAAIAPVILSYIVSEFPAEAMAKGFSLYMLISSGAVIFGPALGGVMLETVGWRAMIWVCSAICAAVFLICLVTLEREDVGKKVLSGFDGPGAALVLIFFSLMLCVPSFGQNFGWSSTAFLTVLGAAFAALAALITVERRAADPILRSGFLFRKNFILPVVALFLTQGLMQANMTNVIVFVNYTQPGNTIISAWAISVMYLGMSLGAVLIGPLADRREPKTVLTASLILTGLGCGLMLLFTAESSFLLLAGALGVLGLGLGGNGTVFMKVVLSGLPPEESGAGTGIYGLFRDLSAPFGVAVFVPMFTNHITTRIAAEMEAGFALPAASAVAAVSAIRTLALVELGCVALGIFVVRMLPKLYEEKGRNRS